MGALHRLVDLLQKLDPNNELWKRDRLAEAERYCQVLEETGAPKDEIAACHARIEDIKKSFDTRFHALDFARKLYLIENGIYGVDIQPVAVQIAKLRFFISLVVDQKVDMKAANLGVRPLPNLETRLVAADTLIPLPKPKAQQGSLFDDATPEDYKEHDRLKKELQRIRHEHFNARDPRKKRRLRDEDARIRGDLQALLQKVGLPAEAARAMSAWDPYDQNTHAVFFDPEWMFGLPVGKIRVPRNTSATLLGNLALVNEVSGQMELTDSETQLIESGFDIVIGNPPYGAKFSSALKRQLSDIYPQAAKIPDSYAFFFLQGLALLRPSGVLGYIAPNTFCDLENGAAFRRHLLATTTIRSFWQSGWVFSAAVVDTLVLLIENSPPNENHEIIVINEQSRLRYAQQSYLQFPLAKIDFRSSPRVLTLREIIRSRTTPLSSTFSVKAGVKMYELGKGSPPQTKEVVASKPYSRTGKSPAGWKVLYRGGDITPFHLSDSGERVHYGPWLAAPRTSELFEPPKILMRRTDDRLMSCLDLSDSICVNSCHVIKLLEPAENCIEKYYATLAVLNSRIAQWMFTADNPQMIGKTFAEIKVVYVERLPLPNFSRAQMSILQTSVELLLLLKQMDFSHPADQSSRDPLMLAYFEQILNGLVYELYFPEELHAAGLHLFDAVAKSKLPAIETIPEEDRLSRLRTLFEILYDGTHPLRIALAKLQTLDTVRLIEGKA